MLRLLTLGTVDLRDADGRELRSVLQQPKRLALLVYLALEGGTRYTRRDVLLDLFWPELDQAHARAALRRALYFLRKALGETLIEARGDEELRLDEEQLWCDAPAVRVHLASGGVEEALALYQGPLLPGFYIAGAAGAERWLDGARRALGQELAEAAWVLAESLETPSATALALGRRAVEVGPDASRSLERLLHLHGRLGQAQEGLARYDDYARRLQLDSGQAPPPELQHLADGLRRMTGSASLPQAEVPFAIAILPFTVHGDAALDYLGEGLMDLLATALDGVGEFRTLDPRSVLAARREMPAWEPGPVPDNATHTISGSVIAADGYVRVGAVLRDRAGRSISRAESQADSDTALFELVDEIVRQLLTRQPDSPAQRLVRLAGLTTPSLPALRAWLQGEHEFRLGRYVAALDAYQLAARTDPAFALAHYRVAGAAAANAMLGPAIAASQLAYQHRGRLSERDRLLVEAQHAWLRGGVDEAERRYQAIVATHPDDLEAWSLLGDLLLHHNPYRGRSIRAAREPLERAARLDPRHVSTLSKLARLDALEQRTTALRNRVREIVALSPAGDRALAMRALAAFAIADQEAMTAVESELQTAPALTLAITFTDVALYTPDLSAVDRLGRAILPMVRSPELQAVCHGMLAHLAAARGRLDQAVASLAEAEALDRGWGLTVRGLLLAVPFLPWPEGTVTAVRQALEEWEVEMAAPNVALPLALHNGLQPHARAYLLGLLAARQGDVSGTVAAAEMLAELPASPDHLVLLQRFGRTLAAELRVLRGDPIGALRELGSVPGEVWFQLAVASPLYAGTHARWRRGQLLQRLGRNVEAAGWLESLAERSPWELPYRQPRRSAE